MDTIFTTLACYLLGLSFAVPQTPKDNLTGTPITTSPNFNLTHITTIATPPNYTVHVTVVSNLTNLTPFTSTIQDNQTFTKTTAFTTESTSPLLTSQSTSITTPLTNSTLQTTTTASAPTFTALTTPATQTTAGYKSTPDTTAITTSNSTHHVNTTSYSEDRTTQGLGLDVSERNMTITFSIVLGVFALVLVVFVFHKCKHKIQYLHQPLNNTGDTADEFVTDDDTLVISGGLYDGHPIYDNMPTVRADQSQFSLQFLHQGQRETL